MAASITRCYSGRFVNLLRTNVNLNNTNLSGVSVRGVKKWEIAGWKEMKARKKLEKNVAIRPRTAFVNWNHSAEIFAFTKRINENLSEETLRQILIHPSYIEKELKSREEFGIASDIAFNLIDNTDFVKIGVPFMSDFVSSYLKEQLSHLPEDGLLALHDYLMSDDNLSSIAQNIGMTDLILSAEFPIENKTLSVTLKALVGAILKNEGSIKAKKFVLELVITQLIGKDIMDIWDICNPMGTLRNILIKQGRSEPETRLLRETGRNTIFSVYVVGLYVDKELIGQGPGETIQLATEMAALDALKIIFRIKDSRTPLNFELSTRNEIESGVKRGETSN